jgi:pimeloyl-ACP methyl ester carboxylesterase
MLNYQIENRNSNKWLVFVHGIGGSTRTWKKQIHEFKDYNLLLLDLPGHGGSQLQNFIVNIKNVNKAIKETLDSLHITKADFIALSLGSLVMANFAVIYPEYIHSLVLGGAVLSIVGGYKYLTLAANALKNILPYRVMFNAFACIMLPKKNHATSRKIFIRESIKMRKDQFCAWISYLTQATHPQSLLERLKQLRLNICFISGDEDACFIKGTVQVAKYLKNSSLHIIEQCGHVCSIEKAEEFNIQAQRYLESLPEDAAA